MILQTGKKSFLVQNKIMSLTELADILIPKQNRRIYVIFQFNG